MVGGPSSLRTSRPTSKSIRQGLAVKHRRNAPPFPALGDDAGLPLLVKLGGGQLLATARLTEGSTLSHQLIG